MNTDSLIFLVVSTNHFEENFKDLRQEWYCRPSVWGLWGMAPGGIKDALSIHANINVLHVWSSENCRMGAYHWSFEFRTLGVICLLDSR